MTNRPVFPILRRAAADVGVRAWAVGGYVRDLLLGRENHDLDIVVEQPRALDLAERFAAVAGVHEPVTYPRFGTAQVRWGDLEIEFVSARRESYADDSRKPEVVAGTLMDDLNRRDFTINAILMSLEGKIYDPLSGRDDLRRRLISTPIPAERTFADDPLRMFRAVRFAAQLGFGLAPEIIPAIRDMRDRARPPKLSVERINEELRKMLLSERPSRALQLLDQGGLVELLVPELYACHGVEQGEHHRADVFWHTLYVVDGTEADLLLRLAAVFHDVGKPLTRGAGGTFYQHHKVGAEMTRKAMERLRFSNDETDAVVKLVELHMQPMRYVRSWGLGGVRRLARDAGDQLPRLIKLARADRAGSASTDYADIDDLEARLALVQAEQPSRFELPIDGHDIMRTCQLSPGPRVGAVLRRVSELVLDGELPPERDVLLTWVSQNAAWLTASHDTRSMVRGTVPDGHMAGGHHRCHL